MHIEYYIDTLTRINDKARELNVKTGGYTEITRADGAWNVIITYGDRGLEFTRDFETVADLESFFDTALIGVYIARGIEM